MPTTRSGGADQAPAVAGKRKTPQKNKKGQDTETGAAVPHADQDLSPAGPHKEPASKKRKPAAAQAAAAAGEEDKEEEAPPKPDSDEPVAGAADRGSKEPLPDNAVEQGKVSFLFKPKVTTPGSDVDVSGLDGVQRMYILLEPEQPEGGKCRLLVVGKKRLPDTQKHERFLAFVEAVGTSPSELTQGLQEHTYTTKTRGERLQPGARPAGDGTYVIAKGGSRNGTHLGFKLSHPSEPGEVQDMLGIKEEASFVLSAKNPDNQRPDLPSAGPEPAYSDEQKEEFEGRSWIGLEDRSLLDVAGTELLLVGAKDNPVETGELGEAGKLLEEA